MKICQILAVPCDSTHTIERSIHLLPLTLLTQPHLWPPRCLHTECSCLRAFEFLFSLSWLLFFQIMIPILTFFRNFMQMSLSQRSLPSSSSLKFQSPVLTKHTFSIPLSGLFFFPLGSIIILHIIYSYLFSFIVYLYLIMKAPSG